MIVMCSLHYLPLAFVDEDWLQTTDRLKNHIKHRKHKWQTITAKN